MADDEPAWRDLTLYLLRPEVTDFAGALRRPDELIAVPLRAEVTLDAALYVLPPAQPEPPDWVRPLSQLASPIPVAATSSPGAVLVFRAEGRMFALPFGRGHFRLRTDRLVDDFGLRIAANLLDADNLVSVDSRAIEQTVFITDGELRVVPESVPSASRLIAKPSTH